MRTRQEALSTVAGDARLVEFWSPWGWRLLALAGLFLFGIVGVWTWGTIIAHVLRHGSALLEFDFRVFWGAARLAVEGAPLAAFDGERLAGTTGASPDHYLPWLYPPGFLLLLTPLGWLPFPAAWVLFTIVFLTGILLAVRPFAGGSPSILMVFGLAPAFVPTVILGQNNLLWLTCLLAALAAVRSGRPLLAGALIGMLTLKPQLGLMIPIALLACGAWRSILSASVMAVLLALGPTILYGVEYWNYLVDAGQMQSERFLGRAHGNDAFLSPYGFLAALGVPLGTAMTLQCVVTLWAGLLVWRTWRDPYACFDLRAGVLLTAIILSTPYLLYYDAAFLPLSMLFLLRAGALRPCLSHRILFGLLWLGVTPVIMGWIYLGLEASPRVWAMPLLLLLTAITAKAVLHSGRDTSTTTEASARPRWQASPAYASRTEATP